MDINDKDILEIKGIKYYAPNREDSIYKSMIKTNDVWEAHIIDRLCKGIVKGSCVVDAGAHIGNHSMQFAKYAKKVFAFEPEPLNYTLLNCNLALNKIDNVYTFQMALSNRKAFYTYNPEKERKRKKNTGATFLVEDEHGSMHSCLLTDLLMESDLFGEDDVISVMKFDVEEMEYEALLGSTSFIKRFKPMLYVEAIRSKKRLRRNKNEVEDLLMAWGYKSVDKKKEIWLHLEKGIS